MAGTSTKALNSDFVDAIPPEFAPKIYEQQNMNGSN
jgi:hypothetical protein